MSSVQSGPSPVISVSKEFQRSGQYYDLFHADKQYDHETAKIVRHLTAGKPVETGTTLIDYGCGTGQFSRRLADYGYSVVGCDISEELLDVARRNHQKPDIRVSFIQKSMCEKLSDIPAMSAVSLFGAFCYPAARGIDETLRCLRAIRSSLYCQSPFLFDVVNTSAAAGFLRERSIKTMELPDGGYLTRSIRKQFNPHTCVLTNTIEFFLRGSNQSVVDSWTEIHLMRTFTPPEITNLLQQAGFCQIQILPPLESHGDSAFVSASDFYFMALAKAAS